MSMKAREKKNGEEWKWGSLWDKIITSLGVQTLDWLHQVFHK